MMSSTMSALIDVLRRVVTSLMAGSFTIDSIHGGEAASRVFISQ
jgi:hypothetical protein